MAKATTSDFFEWRPEFETGIRIIDGDHKQLFDLAKALNDQAALKQPAPDLAPLIDRLVTYVDEHFAREERIMAGGGFPGFDAHVEEHRRATEVIYAIRDVYRADPSDLNVAKVAAFFRDWLKHHIMGNDQQYVPYVKGEKPGVNIAIPTNSNPKPWVNFVTVEIQVPAEKESQLRQCARILSHVGDATERLDALLAELPGAPSPGRLAYVARTFRKTNTEG